MIRDCLYALIITPLPIHIGWSPAIPLRHAKVHSSQIELGGSYCFDRYICVTPSSSVGQTQITFHALDDVCTKIAYAYGAISWFSQIMEDDQVGFFADWISTMLGKNIRFCYSEVDIRVPLLRHAQTLLSLDENGIPMFVHFIFSSINGIIVLDRKYCTVEDIWEMGEEITGEEHTNEMLRHQMRIAIEQLKNEIDEYDWFDVWIAIADENRSVLHPVSEWPEIREFLRELVLINEDNLVEYHHPFDYQQGLHLLQQGRPYLFASPSLVVGTMKTPVLIKFLERIGEKRLRVVIIEEKTSGRRFEACVDSVSWLSK